MKKESKTKTKRAPNYNKSKVTATIPYPTKVGSFTFKADGRMVIDNAWLDEFDC